MESAILPELLVRPQIKKALDLNLKVEDFRSRHSGTALCRNHFL